MQNKATKKPVEIVRKPIIRGSWNGRDAWKMVGGRMLTMLAVIFFYLVGGMLLSLDSLWGRVATCVVVVGAACYYLYASGLAKGQTDAAFGEIIYNRREDGYNVPEDEQQRSFHPLKGLFAVCMGVLPYFLFALVFAIVTQPIVYRLGALPSWASSLTAQTEFGNALSYYQTQPGMTAMDVMRIIDRAMIMPFVNIAVYIGNDAALTVERLSPLLVLIAPMGYALGYSQGLNYRAKVNTGIKMGDDKKKRKERKARKQRQRSKAPERLI